MKKGGLGLTISGLPGRSCDDCHRMDTDPPAKFSSQIQPKAEQIVLSGRHATAALENPASDRFQSALEPFISPSLNSAAYSVATTVFKQGTVKIAFKKHLLCEGLYQPLTVPCLTGAWPLFNSQLYKPIKLRTALKTRNVEG